MREIPDETALPFPKDTARVSFDWIRHKIDPRVLIDCMTGECYTRRDGARWEHPAYTVDKSNDKWSLIRPTTAKYDDAIYSPTSKGRSAA